MFLVHNVIKLEINNKDNRKISKHMVIKQHTSK